MLSAKDEADSKKRSIIHVDMDAFYASVETLDNPRLKNKPLVVGGTGGRGVVSTANYIARQYGIHSAMPATRARRLCPHAVFVRPRIDRYREISRQIFTIFHRYTPEVQGLSLDEAFLDVSASLRLFGEIRQIGKAVQASIYTETGLTASVGMAHNKLLAKLASDYRKPRGRTWVPPDKVHWFMDPLPVGRLWGIGRQTLPKLHAAGILTIGQLRLADQEQLKRLFPHRWESYQRLASGIDDRPVKAEHKDKSVSRETTFDDDVIDIDELRQVLEVLTAQVWQTLHKKSLCARTVNLKLRTRDFHTYSRSRTLEQGIDNGKLILRTGFDLLEEWYAEHNQPAIRLLGIGVSNFIDDAQQENSLL